MAGLEMWATNIGLMLFVGVAWWRIVAHFDHKIERLSERMDRMSERIENLGGRVDSQHAELRERMAKLEGLFDGFVKREQASH